MFSVVVLLSSVESIVAVNLVSGHSLLICFNFVSLIFNKTVFVTRVLSLAVTSTMPVWRHALADDTGSYSRLLQFLRAVSRTQHLPVCRHIWLRRRRRGHSGRTDRATCWQWRWLWGLVCLVQPRDARVTLASCGHQCFCVSCAAQVKDQRRGCPLPRCYWNDLASLLTAFMIDLIVTWQYWVDSWWDGCLTVLRFMWLTFTWCFIIELKSIKIYDIIIYLINVINCTFMPTTCLRA